jgi:hypothetical protein
MKHFYKLKTVLTLALIILGTTLFAQDVTFSFQGILKNFDGTVVLDAGYDMKFVIYTSEGGSDTVWSETQTGVQVTGGVYNTVLGKEELAALAALPFNVNYWVGVTVVSGNNPLEMTPRMKMTGSAYNYRSKLADYADVADSLTPGVHIATVTEAVHATNADLATVATNATNAGHAETATLAYALQAGGPTVPIWATGVPIKSADTVTRMMFDSAGSTTLESPTNIYLKTGNGSLVFEANTQDVFTVSNAGAINFRPDIWHFGGVAGRFNFTTGGSTQFGTGASSGPAYVFKEGTAPWASLFTIDNGGDIKFAENVWMRDSEGIGRIHFLKGLNTYFDAPPGQGHIFRSNGSNLFLIANTGALRMKSGVWHTDMGSGHGRFYFATNGSTQFGTGASGSNPAWHFQTATSTAFAIGNDGAITFTAGVWHKSLDGFHRILFNLNQSTHYDAPLGHGHYFEAGGVNIGIINASGGTFSSDRRFKANIKPLENALANVLQLEGVSFNWNKKKFADEQLRRPNHIGVIAQDLEKIYPEFVVTGEDGYKYVNYAQLTAVLIEAIKELNVIVENQVTKIENQDNKIDNLKADNGELKKDNSSNEARLLKLEEYLQLTTKK